MTSCSCKGPVGAADTVSDTQPLQSPLDGAAALTAEAPGSDPNADRVPAPDFGTTNIVPEGDMLTTTRPSKSVQTSGAIITKH